MLKKVLMILAVSSFCVQFTLVQAAPANPHKAYDQKLRECKKQADQQQLSGEERRVFVAGCVKK